MIVLQIIFFLSILCLGYVFIGYPFLIFLLAKIKPNKITQGGTDLSVSIIIPAFNEEEVIEEKIKNVLGFNFPMNRLEIIIVDDGSDDNTPKIISSYKDQGIQVLTNNPRRGKVAALNHAMKQANGDIFLISDADITSDPNALNILMRNFFEPSVGCVVGRGIVLRNETETNTSHEVYYGYDTRIKISESEIHSSVGVSGHMMAIRRDLLQELPTNILLDDFYLAMMVIKKGYRVIFEPDAISYERPTLSMQDEIKRRRRITAGRYQIISLAKEYLPHLPPLVAIQVVSHKFLRLLIPFFMFFAFISNIIIVSLLDQSSSQWISVGFSTALISQFAFYTAALLGAIYKNPRIKILNLPYYLVATNF
ncbi:MAG: glycosyltransferase family 2 protein, partial [Anaerolineales bacterium]